MNPKIKNILIFIAIFGLAAGAYVLFFKSEDVPPLTNSSGAPVTTVSGSSVGQEFLTTLLNTRNIKLDDAVFNNPAFGRLQDYTITLTPEGDEGRDNPFAPLGAESIPTETVAPTSDLIFTTGNNL